MEIFSYIRDHDLNSIHEYAKTHDLNTIFSLIGWTPLHFACFLKDFEIVKILLESGASPHLGTRDNAKWLPIHTATEPRDTDINIVKLLIDYGSDIYSVPYSSGLCSALSFCYRYNCSRDLGDEVENYYHSLIDIKEPVSS